MRFAPEANHGANAGLEHARNHLEKIKQQFPEITYSDLWVRSLSLSSLRSRASLSSTSSLSRSCPQTLAGVCAIQEAGGPYIPWRAGRKDGDVDNCTPDGRLPDADKGADHIRNIFYRMGMDDKEIGASSPPSSRGSRR